MVKCTFGIIFHVDPSRIDEIVTFFEDQEEVNLVAVKKSWGKLWITEEEAH